MIRTMTILEAVDALRERGIKTSQEKVRQGIRQGVYPWGDCVELKSPDYTVYAKLLEEWLDRRDDL